MWRWRNGGLCVAIVDYFSRDWCYRRPFHLPVFLSRFKDGHVTCLSGTKMISRDSYPIRVFSREICTRFEDCNVLFYFLSSGSEMAHVRACLSRERPCHSIAPWQAVCSVQCALVEPCPVPILLIPRSAACRVVPTGMVSGAHGSVRRRCCSSGGDVRRMQACRRRSAEGYSAG